MTALADSFHFRDDPDAARARAPRPSVDTSMMDSLARMSGETGAPPMRLMRDFAQLSFGHGRITFQDFVRLRLHDDAFWEGADRRDVIGQRRARELALQINHRHDGYALAANRMAANAYLAAFGFPVIPTAAVYAHDVATPSRALLRSRDELRQFLETAAYPLFAKPMEAVHSAAAFGLAGCDPGVLRTLGGSRLSLEGFVDGVRENHWTGYLFQPMLQPHTAGAALFGQRLASVRLLILTGDAEGPRVACAVWTLPAGHNQTDSPARAGNLLAQVDPRNGAILRVTRGSGFELKELTRHPDTGALLVGAAVPGWDALKATAVEAARLMSHLPLAQIDIAPTDAGPVIVQVGEAPDLTMFQLAERQGLYGAGFAEMLAASRQAAAERAELVG